MTTENMNNRELLELAAKAAGLVVFVDPITGEMMENQVRESDGATRMVFWDPLTDDGDALRLAVKLGLSVEQHNLSDEPYAAIAHLTRPYEESGDALTATRLVIVDAAYAIGRAMP